MELEQTRETAGVTMRLIVDHVRRARGEDGVRRLLEEAGETRPLAEPVVLDGSFVETPPSVGAVRLGTSYTAVRDVLRDADAAMYSAKKSGGRGFVVHRTHAVR